MKSIKVFCPASVANVSCGFDVLGFCLDGIGDEIKITKTASKGLVISKITGARFNNHFFSIFFNLSSKSGSFLK